MKTNLRVALVVATTSALSVVSTLMWSEHGLERAHRLCAETTAEKQRIEQGPTAASGELEAEQRGRDRGYCEEAALRCGTQAMRLTGRQSEAVREDPLAAPAIVSLHDVAEWSARRPSGDVNPWEQLRAVKQPVDAATHGADGTARRTARVEQALELDSDQAIHYRDLVSDYEDRIDALYDRVAREYDYAAGQDPLQFQDMLQEIELEKADLEARLDEELLHALTDEQAARYLALPAEERGVGPNAGLDRLDLQAFDLPFVLFSSGGGDGAF